MEKKYILKGASNEFVMKLSLELDKLECTVASENEEEVLDMLIYCIDPIECGPTDYEALLKEYEYTSIQLLKEVSVSLPLLEKGKMKRLCFVTTLASSINDTKDCDQWEKIVSASCNMAIKTIFNRLNPLGYSFRLFAVENFKRLEDASYAAEYFVRNRSLEEESYQHSDEKRLVIRDKYEREYPW